MIHKFRNLTYLVINVNLNTYAIICIYKLLSTKNVGYCVFVVMHVVFIDVACTSASTDTLVSTCICSYSHLQFVLSFVLVCVFVLCVLVCLYSYLYLHLYSCLYSDVYSYLYLRLYLCVCTFICTLIFTLCGLYKKICMML